MLNWPQPITTQKDTLFSLCWNHLFFIEQYHHFPAVYNLPMALHSVLCVSFVSPSEQYRGGQWGLEGGIENHRTAAFCRETERAETLQSAAEKVDREEYGWKLQSYEGSEWHERVPSLRKCQTTKNVHSRKFVGDWKWKTSWTFFHGVWWGQRFKKVWTSCWKDP